MGVLDTFVFDTTRGDNPVDSNLQGDTKPADQGKVADFLTTQSLTWTAVINAVGLIWAFFQQQFKDGSDPASWTVTPAVPLAFTAFIMLAGFFGSWEALKTTPAKVSALMVAVVNTFLLVANFFVGSSIATK